MTRSERTHVCGEPTGRYSRLQPCEVFRCSVCANERLFFCAGEQARSFEARGFDFFERLIEAPFGPGAVEATDLPFDTLRSRLGRSQNGGCGACDNCSLKEFSAIHMSFNGRLPIQQDHRFYERGLSRKNYPLAGC